jgi:Holliday junction resolvase
MSSEEQSRSASAAIAQDRRQRKWRGKRREYELLALMQRFGWKAKRSAMSGSARHDPDVDAVKGDRRVVFECKSSTKKVCLIARKQILRLADSLDFYDTYKDKTMVVAVKFPGSGGQDKPWIFRKVTQDILEKVKADLNREKEKYDGRVAEGKLTEAVRDKLLRSSLKSYAMRVTFNTESDWDPPAV